MARQRFCKACRDWHELDAWPNSCMPKRNTAQSNLSAPMLIQDGMDAVQSQLDGQFYDSKAALRATYKAAGVVEVGNDSSVTTPQPREKPKVNRSEIKATVNKAFSQAGLGA